MRIVFAIVSAIALARAASDNVQWPDGVNCGGHFTERHVRVDSHSGRRDGRPYRLGMRCRFLFAPEGRNEGAAELKLEGRPSLRQPFDFAVVMDGALADEADFICRVDRYLALQEKYGEDKLTGWFVYGVLFIISIFIFIFIFMWSIIFTLPLLLYTLPL